MISGARYSWVPTNDMDRAPVGSATSSGRAAAAPPRFLSRSGASGAATAAAPGRARVRRGALEQRWRDRASQREIEIGEHYVAVLPDEDVLRLQVPVDDPQHVERTMPPLMSEDQIGVNSWQPICPKTPNNTSDRWACSLRGASFRYYYTILVLGRVRIIFKETISMWALSE
ncbi:unnamed protein product [Spirodela intermedia]|uniref:Uncharacterized protein n=1 Tax=Spirodela intermedia TaxID=51605 RepID=A0A7I8JU84_SPIIN|nr:unnamed protein product [Spirodela intermedia]CAA6673748.1 unnamed protein product [Spirodela intermedia]